MNYLIADHDSYSRPGSSSGGVTPGKESAENSAGLHFGTRHLFLLGMLPSLS